LSGPLELNKTFPAKDEKTLVVTIIYRKIVIIQLLRKKPPCLIDICFEAIRLTSCKHTSYRALGIFFFNGLNNYEKFCINLKVQT